MPTGTAARNGAPVRAIGDVEEHAAALAGLPGMTPVRLSKLLDGFQPVTAWNAIRAGTHPADPRRKFGDSARKTDVRNVGERYRHAGVHVLLPGHTGYPSMLLGDPGAPAVLFALGEPTAPEGRPRVAIVGTRSATHYGRQVASDLASELAAAGVAVVSGLARGIDGAAHAGVVRGAAQAKAGPPAAAPPAPVVPPVSVSPPESVAAAEVSSVPVAPPVAVVGTGLDVVYPTSNTELWAEVATLGVVFSESPLGTPPHPGVFPARNRIIAALSDVVVVVESHYGGGSLYTAEAAARRSIPVCAVPGSVHSRASEGSNALLVDGCIPVRDATDVLVAISLARAEQCAATSPGAVPTPQPGDSARSATTRSARPPTLSARAPSRIGDPRLTTDPGMSGSQRAVWDAVDDTPTAFETILIRTDLSIPAVAEACERLVERGVLVSGAGWWSKP